MNISVLIFVLLICFLSFAYSKNLQITKSIIEVSNISNVKFKREIDLEVFSDTKEIKKTKTDENDVINVCGRGLKCVCDEKELSCWDQKLNTTNLRPIIENFVVQKVHMFLCKNFTIEKGKTFPGNEGTINWLGFLNVDITKIDENVFDNFTSLETLILRRSTFPFLGENVLTENLGKSLTTLALDSCEMHEINLSSFKNLVNLQNLDLYGNFQTNGKLNGNFPKSLSKLKILDLESCNLTYLNDDTFEHLTSLEELRMSHNKFKSIPSAIKVLISLKKFMFNGNELKKLKQNDFSSNNNLKFLYLKNNQKLETVENCAFCNLKNLKEISFMNCFKLTYINENAFGAISNGYSPKLEKFNIINCNISVLHENLMDWKNIGELFLKDNPFACNCSMAWLFNDLMSKNSIYEKKLTFWYKHEQHPKFYLGCLGPPPTTPNHTIPYTIVEIFSSCKKFSSTTFYWYILMLFGFIVLIVGLVYANRFGLGNVFERYL